MSITNYSQSNLDSALSVVSSDVSSVDSDVVSINNINAQLVALQQTNAQLQTNMFNAANAFVAYFNGLGGATPDTGELATFVAAIDAANAAYQTAEYPVAGLQANLVSAQAAYEQDTTLLNTAAQELATYTATLA